MDADMKLWNNMFVRSYGEVDFLELPCLGSSHAFYLKVPQWYMKVLGTAPTL